MGNWHVLEYFFRALVGVEKANLEIEDRFARDAEQEMAGLDDAGVDRADRHLENAFAFDGAKLMTLTLEGKQLRLEREILTQGIDFRPVIVQGATARIGMAD